MFAFTNVEVTRNLYVQYHYKVITILQNICYVAKNGNVTKWCRAKKCIVLNIMIEQKYRMLHHNIPRTKCEKEQIDNFPVKAFKIIT